MRLAFAAAVLLLASPAIASEPAAPAAKEKPKKVCKRLETNTGSHLGGSGRVCRTAEEWAKLEKKSAPNNGMMVEKGSVED